MMVAFCIPCSQRGMVELGSGDCGQCAVERDTQEMRKWCAYMDAENEVAAFEAAHPGIKEAAEAEDLVRRLLEE